MGVHVGGGIDPIPPYCSISYDAEISIEQVCATGYSCTPLICGNDLSQPS
jgi:hypothetical protein